MRRISALVVTLAALLALGVPAFASAATQTLTVSKKGTGTGTVTSSPAGFIECGSTCSAPIPEGTTIVLKGSSGSNTAAVVWSGCTKLNLENECSVTIGAEPKTITASFNLLERELKISKPGTGPGTVTSKPAGLECGATCSASFIKGTVVTLTGTPSGNSEPVVWFGCDSITEGRCVVTMSTAKSVTATFDLPVVQLSISKAGTGIGTVTSKPAGIECGVTCAAPFAEQSTVTLTGVPGANSTPVQWTGCTSVGDENKCLVTMSAAKEVTATFKLVSRRLTVFKSGTGTGKVTSTPAGISCGGTCSAEFEEGTKVTLEAAESAGSEFIGWSGSGCSGAGTCKVTMSAAREVTAEFKLDLKPKFKLTVTKLGTGTGKVTSTPAGISCGGTCSAKFGEGKVVELAEAPEPGSEFLRWSSNCKGTGDTCEVTMSAAKSVQAVFRPIPIYKLTVKKSGSGSGRVTSSTPITAIDCGLACEAKLPIGTEVELAATPTPGSEFFKWSGACAGTGICKVTMSAARSVHATFKAAPAFVLSVARSGRGTVTSSPAGISCGAVCAHQYPGATTITLSATAARGYRLKAWTGCDSSSGPSCTVTIAAARTVDAAFVLAKCKKGFRKKTIKGKPRCVRTKRHGAHRRGARNSLAPPAFWP